MHDTFIYSHFYASDLVNHRVTFHVKGCHTRLKIPILGKWYHMVVLYSRDSLMSNLSLTAEFSQVLVYLFPFIFNHGGCQLHFEDGNHNFR